MYVSADIAFPEDDAPTKVARIGNRKADEIVDAVRDALERLGLTVDRVELFDD